MAPSAPAFFSAAQRDGGRLRVRAQRVGHAGGAAEQVDGDLAAEILAGEVVDLQLGDRQAVADERERRLDLRRRIDAHRERGVRSERDRFDLAVAHQRQARLRLDDLPRRELDGLQVARGAGRRQAGRLELLGDVGRRLLVALAAGVAALEVVARQERDVRPPARRGVVGGGTGGDERAGDDGRRPGGMRKRTRTMRRASYRRRAVAQPGADGAGTSPSGGLRQRRQQRGRAGGPELVGRGPVGRPLDHDRRTVARDGAGDPHGRRTRCCRAPDTGP